ncbi:hypothetical protein [Algoriphagus boritolerans]|uniref:hypothetical protein n=1 Tax=Algoriphagus boritolerans TaxID=308111 RepID=UPI000B14AA5C
MNQETSDAIKMPPVYIESQLGQSLGGVLYGFIGRVNSLKLKNLSMREVLTSYPERNTFSEIIVATGRQGSLGSEVLGRTRLILDYPKKKSAGPKG